jgi:hypothetical protein
LYEFYGFNEFQIEYFTGGGKKSQVCFTSAIYFYEMAQLNGLFLSFPRHAAGSPDF